MTSFNCSGWIMLLWILWITVILQMPVFVDQVSVHFKTRPPLYVALGQTLVLEAVFEKKPEEKIDMVTWDRERGKENIRLSGTQNSKISFEKEDSLLRITEVTDVDFAVYKVTVTDSNGYQQHDSIEVRKIVDPPKASVTRVLECLLEKHGMSQWDSPRFSWTVDGVPVTDPTALLADGSRLNISEIKGVNYTCVINSSLGTLVTHYQIPTESQACCTVLIVAAVLTLVALVAGFVFLMKGKKIKRMAISTSSTN